eukprot:3172439-Amphidinium_carterae.1
MGKGRLQESHRKAAALLERIRLEEAAKEEAARKQEAAKAAEAKKHAKALSQLGRATYKSWGLSGFKPRSKRIYTTRFWILSCQPHAGMEGG